MSTPGTALSLQVIAVIALAPVVLAALSALLVVFVAKLVFALFAAGFEA